MNLYHCAIDLPNAAKALSFANAVDAWMSYLKSAGVIENWRLMRRKLNLAADRHRDFLLEIEVTDLAQLDRAFRLSGNRDEAIDRLYHDVHSHIAAADFGLFRPFPDPERAERIALI